MTSRPSIADMLERADALRRDPHCAQCPQGGRCQSCERRLRLTSIEVVQLRPQTVDDYDC